MISRINKLFNQIARRQVFRFASSIDRDAIVIREENSQTRFGPAEGFEIEAEIDVINSAFYRRVASGPVAFGESFVDGDWDSKNLTEVIRVLLRNRALIDAVRNRWSASLSNLGRRATHLLRRNSRSGSKKNIVAHYDLGNEFYSLWLDPTMAYSAGIFLDPSKSMEDASVEKFDRICRKLELNQHDHVVEIGTGWGGFAIHAAQKYGCRVTTTTISDRQYSMAKKRIKELGLQNQIQVLNQDYRQLEGTYSKLVSIEMIEAVGHQYLDEYFRKCASLLSEGGSMLIQAIVMPERGYDRYLRSVDFMQKHIFPGGCLPSVSSLLESVGRTSTLRWAHGEDMGLHYAETLKHWRVSFENRLEQIRQLGCGEDLIRAWRYYLSYCEAAFAERAIGVMQLQFDHAACRRDPMRIGEQAASYSLADHLKRRSDEQSCGENDATTFLGR